MLSFLFFAALTLTAANDDAYTEIPLNQVPKPVAQAVMKKYPDAQPQNASRGIDENKPFYDVFIKVKGQNIWITCDERGTILTVDREIAAHELPKGVAEALSKKYPKAAIRMVNEITEDKSTVFDVAITFQNKPLIAIFSADGRFLEEMEDDPSPPRTALAK